MKKISIAIIAILAISLVSAVVLTTFGTKTTEVTVSQAITMSDCDDILTAAGGETLITGQCTATSETSVDIPTGLVTTVEPEDGGVESVEVQYQLHAEAESPREDRIKVTADQAGLTDLDSLDTISWQQNVLTGYIGHVDVILEDKTLVFEYAKVKAPCDNAPYPTGKQDTFGDKGTVDDTAYAWISSGPAGPCGDATFDLGHNTLAKWKVSDGTKEIIALEFEVDSWIATSTTKISELKVNGNDVNIITVQPEQNLLFDLAIHFANGAFGTYALETNLTV